MRFVFLCQFCSNSLKLFMCLKLYFLHVIFYFNFLKTHFSAEPTRKFSTFPHNKHSTELQRYLYICTKRGYNHACCLTFSEYEPSERLRGVVVGGSWKKSIRISLSPITFLFLENWMHHQSLIGKQAQKFSEPALLAESAETTGKL